MITKAFVRLQSCLYSKSVEVIICTSLSFSDLQLHFHFLFKHYLFSRTMMENNWTTSPVKA